MVKSTPFIGDYRLRFNYSKLYKLAEEFNIDSVSAFAETLANGKLGEKGLIRALAVGLQTLHPMITEDDLIKEGGLFDQFFEEKDSGYAGIVNDVLVQSLVDAGILSRGNTQQVADGGNPPSQSTTG